MAIALVIFVFDFVVCVAVLVFSVCFRQVAAPATPAAPAAPATPATPAAPVKHAGGLIVDVAVTEEEIIAVKGVFECLHIFDGIFI